MGEVVDGDPTPWYPHWAAKVVAAFAAHAR